MNAADLAEGRQTTGGLTNDVGKALLNIIAGSRGLSIPLDGTLEKWALEKIVIETGRFALALGKRNAYNEISPGHDIAGPTPSSSSQVGFCLRKTSI
jgi:hypothetical protein